MTLYCIISYYIILHYISYDDIMLYYILYYNHVIYFDLLLSIVILQESATWLIWFSLVTVCVIVAAFALGPG